MRDLMRLLRLYAPYRRWIFGAIGLGLATVLANFGLLALSGWFLASAGLVGLAGYAAQNAFNFYAPAAGVRFFATVRVLARYGGRLADHEATLRLLAELRVAVYARLEPLAPAALSEDRSGELLNRLVADVDRLGDFFLRAVSPFAVAGLGSVVMVLVFATFSPVAAVVLMLGLGLAGVVVPLTTLLLGQRRSRRLTNIQVSMRSDLVDSVQGMTELLIYGASQTMIDQVHGQSQDLTTVQGGLARVSGLGAALNVLASGMTMTSILVIGAALVMAHRLAAPDSALLALGAMAAFEAVSPLPAAFQNLGGIRESARRVFELTDRVALVREPEFSPKKPTHLDLRLSEVRLRYPGQAGWALDGLNLVMEPGERISILGRSGAGKTSLVYLLLRFADYQQGSAMIGGIELHDIRGDDLRSLFTVVSERTQIFAGSIRHNLLIAKPDANEAELWQALQMAQLSAFVRQQPDGLDTLLGEAGAKISGGEARRVSLARAALRQTPFLILDEPTEGLDPVTASNFGTALASLASSRTVITITHRLDNIDDADRVAVLQAGRIIEDGRFGVLRAAGGALSHLAELQEKLVHV